MLVAIWTLIFVIWRLVVILDQWNGVSQKVRSISESLHNDLQAIQQQMKRPRSAAKNTNLLGADGAQAFVSGNKEAVASKNAPAELSAATKAWTTLESAKEAADMARTCKVRFQEDAATIARVTRFPMDVENWWAELLALLVQDGQVKEAMAFREVGEQMKKSKNLIAP